ncbi:MAG: thiamine pyrophosphate-binding protein [Chloroflexota bacterium]
MSLEQAILTELKKCGIRWLAWLPDSETIAMYEAVMNDPDIQFVQVCRENEAFGVCHGLQLGGERAAVMVQNTGLMNGVDALRGICLRMKQPMLLLVGYRGYRFKLENPAYEDNAPTFTEPLLQAFNVPCHLVQTQEDVEKISQAYEQAQQMSGPIAVLITQEE